MNDGNVANERFVHRVCVCVSVLRFSMNLPLDHLGRNRLNHHWGTLPDIRRGSIPDVLQLCVDATGGGESSP
jgi:hypothetical protein